MAPWGPSLPASFGGSPRFKPLPAARARRIPSLASESRGSMRSLPRRARDLSIRVGPPRRTVLEVQTLLLGYVPHDVMLFLVAVRSRVLLSGVCCLARLRPGLTLDLLRNLPFQIGRAHV